jgi:hypothetical protein
MNYEATLTNAKPRVKFKVKARSDRGPQPNRDHVDLHGALKLEAKMSETMTGWKRGRHRNIGQVSHY